MSTVVIEARGVEKTYGVGPASVAALGGVDLQVSQGELLAIMGPSGSGKSTLLHVLAGLETPTRGQVLVEGTDLASLDDDRRTFLRRRRLGVVFQSCNLLAGLTAEENVALPLLLEGVPASRSRERARQWLQRIGMDERRDHFPSGLSGGEQQRAAIARALVLEPAVLLADEPTGNLDSAGARHVAGLLRKLVDQQRQTVVLVTHDPNIAGQADRVVHLCDGRISDHHGAPVREPRRE